MENNDIFGKWKQQLECIEPIKQIDCLRIIELNICSLCNLECSFCPYSLKLAQSGKPYMSIDIVHELASQLSRISYSGYICIAGHGEPAMHPALENIVEMLKNFKVVLVTNGTLLSKAQIARLSPICQIKVSVHDWSKIDAFKEKFKESNAIFRNHDPRNPQMNLYNRGGCLSKPQSKLETMCYYPFYKLMVDIDGHYMQCEADWAKKSKTPFSLFETPIDEYFCLNASKGRELMLQPGHRQNLSLCQDCDINGMLAGEKFVDFYINRRSNEER